MEPTVLIMVGMAGSGKTSVTQRLFSHLHASGKEIPYVVNLDPAVLDLPYSCDIDIRDSVDYQDVMTRFKLGPNGAIMTCLNIFAAQLDPLLQGLEEAGKEVSSRFAILDTPGQIEVFTWSASGSIITESISSTHRTVLVYVVDTPRCIRPATFMSNMLYACSIMYKTQLPLVVVYNKIDMTDCSPIVAWMQDWETFRDALASDVDSESFMSSLVNSMSLLLEEFYCHLKVIGVSSLTGEGFDGLLNMLISVVNEGSKVNGE